ncbi:MAG TPA: HDIG domain-containing protein [Sphingobacteriaceae bacterium]|nr:HDIG domain-containing protein [Sphingobacteriaceae bacterium]
MATINNSHILINSKYPSGLKFIMMALCVLIVTIFLPKQARFRYEYEKGKVWMHNDLVSPYNFAVQKTPLEVSEDKKQILRSVFPLYQNDKEIVNKAIENYLADFDNKWHDSILVNKNAYRSMGLRLLQEVYSKGIITPVKKFQRDNQHYNFNLLTNNISTNYITNDVYTVESAFNYIDSKLNLSASGKYKTWLLSVLRNNIFPNYIYDERLTDKLEADAISNISITRGMVQKGEVIVSNGTLINDEIYQKLESLRGAYEEDINIVGDRRLVLVGQFLLVALVITLLIVFLFLFRKDIYHDNRQVSLILLVVTGMILTLSWAIKIKIPSLYYIPYCIVPIIIRILFDTRLALNIHLLVVLIGGFFVPNSFEFAFLQITSGMVAIYSIKNFVRREQFLISALLILCNYLVSYLAISLIRNGSFYQIDWYSFVPFVFSVLLSLLAYPLIYAFEKMFGITSDITLMELTNTNSKLLRDLSYKAPGTFQHSLQVANLAEAAIFKIGGNALLVRAGALYHDIGKMENPQYFIENQNKGSNPHDAISYEQSAQIIIRHVHHGIEIAHKYNLPEMIIDFIKTHHGTTRVDYFYQSFLKNFPEKIVDENTFRYPGPAPFSKETSVLMLADSVEAASRSLKEPDEKSINDLVDRIIEYKLDQHQLTDSSITIHDIETIKVIFKSMLMSIYHIRIDYALQI